MPRGGRRDQRRGAEPQAAPADVAAPPAAAMQDGAASPAETPSPETPRTERPPRQGHKGRPDRPHGQRSRSPQNRNDQDRPNRSHREREGGRPFFKASSRPEPREAADPNSPFAKLAALKAQLEADAKERR